MKNRKTVVVAFLLIASMLMGIGYATLTDTLTIEGTASVKPEIDSHVYFIKAETSAGVFVDYSAQDNKDDVTFTVASLEKKGDTATFSFTVKNDSPDLGVTVTPVLPSSECFTIKCDETSYELAAGGTIVIKVTVELDLTPTSDYSETFTVKLDAKTK